MQVPAQGWTMLEMQSVATRHCLAALRLLGPSAAMQGQVNSSSWQAVSLHL